MKQRRKKTWIAVGLIVSLLCAGILPAQASQQNISKEEVVYANLQGDGTVDTIYVVNSFTLNEAGQIIDYGDYTALRNMTSMEELQFEDQCVTVDAEAGKLYYEGILNNNTLPWQFQILYWLDGQAIAAEDLAGKNGHLQIDIQTAQNKACNPIFFDNYALQITVQLDTKLCRNIRADHATIASVGRNKQIIYTILPGQDSVVSISADVTDFEMEQISLNGITLSMALELNEEQYGALTNGMHQISNTAVQFDDGTLELFEGTKKLHDGANTLNMHLRTLQEGINSSKSGSGELRDGLSTLHNGAKSLRDGAKTAVDGADTLKRGSADLSDAATQLQTGADKLLTGATQLHDGIAEVNGYLRQLDATIRDMEESLDVFKKGLEQSEQGEVVFDNISSVTTTIDWDYILQEYAAEIETLKQNIAQLKETREKVRELYEAMLELEEGSARLMEGMEALYDGTAELKKGTVQLAEGSTLLHEGLIVLADGTTNLVSGTVPLLDGSIQLSDGLAELEQGSVSLCDGAIALEDGVLSLEDGLLELHGGTIEFRDKTANLDRKVLNKLRASVDDIFGNGDAVGSFVSEKNQNVQAVQFLIRTPAIEITEEAEQQAQMATPRTFLQKLLHLFGL